MFFLSLGLSSVNQKIVRSEQQQVGSLCEPKRLQSSLSSALFSECLAWYWINIGKSSSKLKWILWSFTCDFLQFSLLNPLFDYLAQILSFSLLVIGTRGNITRHFRPPRQLPQWCHTCLQCASVLSLPWKLPSLPIWWLILIFNLVTQSLGMVNMLEIL